MGWVCKGGVCGGVAKEGVRGGMPMGCSGAGTRVCMDVHECMGACACVYLHACGGVVHGWVLTHVWVSNDTGAGV